MTEAKPRAGSLVLYKGRPARVIKAGDKFEIELEDNTTVRVRLKDISLLHPGPLESLGELKPIAGEVETAWELLLGGPTCLSELAELAYGEYTPHTAWASWLLVDDGTYFRGTPESLEACSAEQIAQERAAREAKAAEERAWEAFVSRVRAGAVLPEDERYLKEVEALALGQQETNRLLHQLGKTESAENAHALLLKLGFWGPEINPYPQRLGLSTTQSETVLPGLTPEERVDLTHLAAYAIDDEDNEDPDDALSLEGNRLWVHVADVAAMISPDSPADLEARSRGVTLYLPEGTVHMLPPKAVQALGMGLIEVSPALSFGLDLQAGGEVSNIEIVPSWVRVTRLSYEEVEGWLEEEPFRSLYRIARDHEERRLERGALTIEMPEVKISADGTGQVHIRPLPALRSRDLVREAMLIAGEAVARLALKEGIPFLFTTQEPPDLAEEIEEVESLAGMYAMRRKLKPSQQSSSPDAHAGLGMEVYTQCTSPLRRYLDLVAHQQLRALLRGGRLLQAQDILERVGAASAVSGAIRQSERLSRRHWTLVYLMQHPDWQGEGVLVEKRGRRATVLIPELDLEPRLHLRGDIPLNSVVPLKLRGLSLAELDAHFAIAE